MPNKPKQTKVKVCNHKPGDIWDDGCCGDESAKNKSSEIISDTQSMITEVYHIQINQSSNEQENTLANPQK